MATPAPGMQRPMDMPVERSTRVTLNTAVVGLIAMLLGSLITWAATTGSDRKQLEQTTAAVSTKVNNDRFDEYGKRVDMGFEQINARLERIERRLDESPARTAAKR